MINRRKYWKERPVRDEILVENEYRQAALRRPVRDEILVENEYRRAVLRRPVRDGMSVIHRVLPHVIAGLTRNLIGLLWIAGHARNDAPLLWIAAHPELDWLRRAKDSGRNNAGLKHLAVVSCLRFNTEYKISRNE